MSAAVRLSAFALALLVVFALGLGLGAAAGPFGDSSRPEPHEVHR
jgi:hypothetical protein